MLVLIALINLFLRLLYADGFSVQRTQEERKKKLPKEKDSAVVRFGEFSVFAN